MTPHSRRPLIGLGALSLAAGLVDATSYLGLGHVFTANMTGNVVFLAFALAGTAGFSVTSSLLALVGFLVGAVSGGRFVPPRPASGRARAAFGTQAGLLAVVVVLSALASRHPEHTARYLLVFLLGTAMGLQNAAVRRLAIPDTSTTVVTSTLASLATDSLLAKGHNTHAGRRVSTVVMLFTGAAIGALLESRRLTWSLLLATIAVICGGAIATADHGRSGHAGDDDRAGPQ